MFGKSLTIVCSVSCFEALHSDRDEFFAYAGLLKQHHHLAVLNADNKFRKCPRQGLKRACVFHAQSKAVPSCLRP